METKIKVLVAEDDPNLGNILKTFLDVKGFEPHWCTDGEEAYNTFLKQKFELCILDVMMPIKDGFTLAKDIRKMDKKIPIIFLTAKSLQNDVIDGLEIGADDYMTKPFSIDELLLRIKAVLRRTAQSNPFEIQENIYKIGNYVFDYLNQLLKIDNQELKLTSKESELLKLLCVNANDVLDRSIALNKVWESDSYYNARSMDVYIVKLRKYLKGDPNVELINVHGKGFKLVINN